VASFTTITPLALGAHAISAFYVGDSTHASSTGNFSQTINYAPGDLIVTRVGTGTGALTANATATVRENYTTAGTANAANTVALPVASSAATISAASESGATVTITTGTNHNFAAGQAVIISGMTPSGYNGTF